MALICISLTANNFKHLSCVCHLYILFGEESSLRFKVPMLRISEKNYFKYTEYNLFLIPEVIVMDYNYKMGLELPGSFWGLLSGVVLLMSLSGFSFLLLVCLILAAIPFPVPFLVYCFYEMIMNKPVRIVFEKE